jgi:hypothetical protein
LKNRSNCVPGDVVYGTEIMKQINVFDCKITQIVSWNLIFSLSISQPKKPAGNLLTEFQQNYIIRISTFTKSNKKNFFVSFQLFSRFHREMRTLGRQKYWNYFVSQPKILAIIVSEILFVTCMRRIKNGIFLKIFNRFLLNN